MATDPVLPRPIGKHRRNVLGKVPGKQRQGLPLGARQVRSETNDRVTTYGLIEQELAGTAFAGNHARAHNQPKVAHCQSVPWIETQFTALVTRDRPRNDDVAIFLCGQTKSAITLNLFAKLARWFPVLPLAGANARFQPIWAGDVAACFTRALVDNETIGERYGLCGPKVYTLAELVRYVAEITGYPRPVVPLSPGLSMLQARFMEWLPGPLLTRDNLASMQVDSVCDAAFPARFSVVPMTLEAIAPEYLAPAAQHSRFDLFRAHGGR